MQKVRLLCCAASFVIAAYFFVRLIPHDLRALHLDFLAVPSDLMNFFLSIKVQIPH